MREDRGYRGHVLRRRDVVPFPLTVPPSERPPLVETIYADGDLLVTGWEDEGGATSDLFESVDSESDADWAELTDANRIPDTVICPTTTTRTLRFDGRTYDPYNYVGKYA